MVDEKDPRIITPIPKALLARIDDYRFEKRLPSRSEAIRRLIEAGLQAAQTPLETSGSTPGGTRKPASAKTAPRVKNPTAPSRKTSPAAASSKEAQIRALREQGA